MLTPLTHDDPERLGAYHLLARMGSGGMGVVYLARTSGGRTVALKTVHARLAADPALRSRFRLEVDAARVIGEQYGARVVDADVAATTPWFAAEYVIGPPLGAAVELAGPLPEATVRAVGAGLCGALAQLHRSDVVHRDLKPSNIMVTAHGPKVIDFGIARALGDARLTRTGAEAGTPAFMSPEQASGQEHTPEGDVFALAGVLVFAATGRGPFGDGQPADLLYRVRYAEPDLSGVPEGLASVLARCLAKDAAARPGTGELMAQLHDGAGEFADHLPHALLVDIGNRAAGVWLPPPERLPPPPREEGEGDADHGAHAPPARRGLSRRGLLAAGGGSVLALAAGAGAWAYSATRDGPAPYEKPPPGPSVSASRKRRDWRWQSQIPSSDMDPVPAVPRLVGDLVVMQSGAGHVGVETADGTNRWDVKDFYASWQTASDGKRLLRIVDLEDEKDRGNAAAHFPLTVAAVDLADGSRRKASFQLAEYNGALDYNQLVCAAGGAVYLVAGRGKQSMDGFGPGNSWALVAVDATSGHERWSSPLPRRKKGDRLHVLDAQVAGDRLVLLQQTAGGKVRVVAHDTGGGRTVWDKPYPGSPEPAAVVGRLRVDGDHVYLGGDALRALRLSDGKEAWRTQPEVSGGTFGPPSVAGGTVYAVEEGRGLLAVAAASGKRKWREKDGEENKDGKDGKGGGKDGKGGGKEGKGADAGKDGGKRAVADPPVVARGHVYVRDSSGLRAVALSSRRTVRTYETVGTRFLADVESGVILASGGQFLAAFDLV